MRKIIYIIAILMASITAKSQYTNIGNTLQQKISGLDTIYRFSTVPGYMFPATRYWVGQNFVKPSSLTGFVTLGTPQSITGNKNYNGINVFNGSSTFNTSASFVDDALRIYNNIAGFRTTFTNTGITANRNVLWPNKSGTVAFLDDITAGGVDTGAVRRYGEDNIFSRKRFYGNTSFKGFTTLGDTATQTIAPLTVRGYGYNSGSIGDYAAGQLVIADIENPNKMLQIGYNGQAGNGFAFLNSGWAGNAWTHIAINPVVGGVTIGTNTLTSGYMFDVNARSLFRNRVTGVRAIDSLDFVVKAQLDSVAALISGGGSQTLDQVLTTGNTSTQSATFGNLISDVSTSLGILQGGNLNLSNSGTGNILSLYTSTTGGAAIVMGNATTSVGISMDSVTTFTQLQLPSEDGQLALKSDIPVIDNVPKWNGLENELAIGTTLGAVMGLDASDSKARFFNGTQLRGLIGNLTDWFAATRFDEGGANEGLALQTLNPTTARIYFNPDYDSKIYFGDYLNLGGGSGTQSADVGIKGTLDVKGSFSVSDGNINLNTLAEPSELRFGNVGDPIFKIRLDESQEFLDVQSSASGSVLNINNADGQFIFKYGANFQNGINVTGGSLIVNAPTFAQEIEASFIYSTGDISLDGNITTTDLIGRNVNLSSWIFSNGFRNQSNFKTSNYTLLNTDYTTRVNATVGTITITLPDANDNYGAIYNIKKIDNSSNLVTLDGNGSTIDGATTKSISSPNSYITVQSDGANWQIIGGSPENYVSSLRATNSTAIPLTKSTLNSTYPSAPIGMKVICTNINAVYEKYDSTNWYSTTVTFLP